MYSKVSLLGIKSIVWYFNKTMRHAIFGLHVDENSLNQVKNLLKSNHRVILMPIYKSFADAFVYTYIHNHFKLEPPFMLGNFEDTPNIKLFEKLLK